MLKEGILPGDYVFSFIIAQTAEVFQRKEEKKGIFCDFFIVYLSCADGAQEDRPRPSCESPRPEERRSGLLLSSGLLTFSATCVPRLICTVAQFRLVQRRMEQVPSRLSYVDLQGAISMLSGSFCFVARSTPSVQFARVSPFDFVKMKVLCVCVRVGSNTYPLHLHCVED